MPDSIRLQVLTPVEVLLEIKEADWVKVALADGGAIGIYPGHAPLLAETVTAPIRYADVEGQHTFEVRAGILEIDRHEVTVYTTGSAQPSEIEGAVEQQEETRFDRLTRELLARLEDEPEGILEQA